MSNYIQYFLLGFFVSIACAHDISNQVTITTDALYRYIKSNGIPYEHGQFPNQGNPNSIKAQNYNFRVPLKPVLAGQDTQLRHGMFFGVGLDGVPFDPGTAEYWNNNRNWNYEAMSGKINLGIDQNNAHVQPNGAYHYHGVPTELISGLSSVNHSGIVGYAADGFPIYALYGYAQATNTNAAFGIKELQSSYQLRIGTRASGPGGSYDGTYTADFIYVADSGDLDECNGRTGLTPDYPTGTYSYFITNTFPLVPRCFKGAPDQSFSKQGPDGPARSEHMRGNGQRPPPNHR